MPPVPTWFWFLVAVLLILAILFFLGVRLDLQA